MHQAKAALDLSQQQRSAVRSDRAAVEAGHHRLAFNRFKCEQGRRTLCRHRGAPESKRNCCDTISSLILSPDAPRTFEKSRLERNPARWHRLPASARPRRKRGAALFTAGARPLVSRLRGNERKTA